MLDLTLRGGKASSNTAVQMEKLDSGVVRKQAKAPQSAGDT